MAPSQSLLAVAGVQVAERQQSSLVPFFRIPPEPVFQLASPEGAPWASTDNGAASAAVANSAATVFSFFNSISSLGKPQKSAKHWTLTSMQRKKRPKGVQTVR